MRIEEINKMKLRFFTNVSHEFRTPLTLIIGQIEMMLQMDKISPAVTKRLQTIYRNAMNLRILITELLDFRKQEQGFMKLKVECVDVVPFVKDIYRSFAELARRKDISLHLTLRKKRLICGLIHYKCKRSCLIFCQMLLNILPKVEI